jgi:hypothetical protein
LAERWLMAMRYRGLAKLRVSSVRSRTEGEDPLTNDEIKSLQAAVRRPFVETLLAEVEN